MRFVAPLDKGLHLRSVPLFGDLPADRIALLVEYASEELITAGRVFQDADAPVDAIRVVVEGEVENVFADGKTAKIGPDSVVGVFEFFAGTAHTTLRAINDVVVLSIPTSAIRDILEEHFDVVVHIFSGLGHTLIQSLTSAPTLSGNAAAPTLAPHPDHPTEYGEVDCILALRNTLAFRDASVDGLSALARTAEIKTFTKDAMLWGGNDEASWLGVILHGVVECETPIRNELFYFSEEGPNAVGFLDTLAADNRWYRARAMADVVVLSIQKDALLDILEDHFDMTLACLRAFSRFSLAIVERLHGMPNSLSPSSASKA